MSSLGSPFRAGTPSNVAVGVIVVLAASTKFVASGGQSKFLLVLIIVVLAATARNYSRYRKFAAQRGLKFIGDEDAE